MSDRYDTDFFAWTQRQAAALAAGKAAELDWLNLAEEIESLGKSDLRQLENRLAVLVRHLLKWAYQPERRRTGHSWQRTGFEQRRRIRRLLRDSPSLRQHVLALIEEEYPSICRQTAMETGLPLETFPETCPWTSEQVLDETFWPGDS
jgi:Domain of unknown function DUF29